MIQNTCQNKVTKMGNFFLILVIGISSFVVAVSSLRAMNCYEYGTKAIELRSVSLSPRSLRIPGVSRVEVDLIVRESVGTPEVPLKARISLNRLVGFGWWSYEVPVPCLEIQEGLHIGTCEYEDICQLVSRINALTNNTLCVGAEYYDFPCNCPIETGRYSTGNKRPIRLDLTQVTDQVPGVLSALLEGEYVIVIEVMKNLTEPAGQYDDNLLGCFEAELDVIMV